MRHGLFFINKPTGGRVAAGRSCVNIPGTEPQLNDSPILHVTGITSSYHGIQLSGTQVHFNLLVTVGGARVGEGE